MTETTPETAIDRRGGGDDDRPHRQHASADVAPELFESVRGREPTRSHEPVRDREPIRSQP
ncbi:MULTISPECIES: hypothetical protein [Haloferacaceae]|uniref:Uncharacterized protein n=1 Tax=Halorubrum glutamatedens TaxID=2707018 RepID=A0ABD5QVT8_9EURY|nr:hypothetical protein [Halobellus captivus]